MVLNPLFDNNDDPQTPANGTGYILPNRHGRKLQPLHTNLQHGGSIHPAHPAAHVSPLASTNGAILNNDAAPEEGSAAAVDLIRRKVEMLFAKEPDAAQELQAAAEEVIQPSGRNKHQQFMHDLSTSGKSLAEMQAAWHDYYTRLPDDEKHAVWQEFYAANSKQHSAYTNFVAQHPETAHSQQVVVGTVDAPASHNNPHTEQLSQPPQTPLPKFARRNRRGHNQSHKTASNITPPSQNHTVPTEHAPAYVPSERPAKPVNKHVAALKHQIKKRVKVNAAAQAKAKQHLKSLVFGLGTGSIVILIVLFGLFNQVVITPFIQPSRHASATPIILSTSDVAPTPDPEVIIPKINLEIPVDYTQTTTDEKAIEAALNTGTVHYASTAKPGEIGNVGIFGHSSNNIFNPGKYKFAFVLLHTLVPGDIFYLTHNNKVYSYRVFDKQVVSPSNVGVLNPVAGKLATVTLITCDPPGTSLNRLVVWGEQINPNPNINASAVIAPTATAPAKIVGNGSSLWQRITSWF